ncbi:MAG: phosphopantothenoylcysteine decarboxylase [Verrucomicrobiota bacterium]
MNSIPIRCLITAGPTREYIDPVRFISNPSSGKMGFAIAAAAAAQGWSVDLVSGPVSLVEPDEVIRYPVETGEEMFNAVDALFDPCDIFISTAAVMDFRPRQRFQRKVKKHEADMEIAFEATTDILATMSERKVSQVMVGFAAETDAMESNALGKLQRKDLDYVVGNLIGGQHGGFGADENEVLVLGREGERYPMALASKQEIASALIELLEPLVIERRASLQS